MALRLNDIYTNRKAYEFDERSQLDERMSQQSTSSKRNSSDSLKAKLREPNAYTTDDAIDIVENELNRAKKRLEVLEEEKNNTHD
jgi:hypothetical protein